MIGATWFYPKRPNTKYFAGIYLYTYLFSLKQEKIKLDFFKKTKQSKQLEIKFKAPFSAPLKFT
jgi:hypothetical protein